MTWEILLYYHNVVLKHMMYCCEVLKVKLKLAGRCGMVEPLAWWSHWHDGATVAWWSMAEILWLGRDTVAWQSHCNTIEHTLWHGRATVAYGRTIKAHKVQVIGNLWCISLHMLSLISSYW